MKLTKAYKQENINRFYSKHNIWSKDDLIRAAERKGSCFFSKDTMRFFSSKVVDMMFPAKNGVYFVTSELCDVYRQGPRKFTVRFYNPIDGDIKTIGEFGDYSTKANALTSALNCAFDSLNANELK